MKTFLRGLFFVVVLQSSAASVFAQQADAPIYKDGDWWKVRVEDDFSGGRSRSGFCQDLYSQYVVRIEQGKPQVYGLKDGNQEKIKCAVVVNQLLGTVVSDTETPEFMAEYVKFPISIGKTWNSTFVQRTPGRNKGATRNAGLDYQVLSFEKVQTPKGEVDVFKIEVSGWPKAHGQTQGQVRTYYYAPQLKASVNFQIVSEHHKRTVILEDFNLAEDAGAPTITGPEMAFANRAGEGQR